MVEVNIIILDLLIAGVTAFVTFFVGVRHATRKMLNQHAELTQMILDKQTETDKDIELIKKCMIVTTKLTDTQTKKAHPDAYAELSEIAEAMLNKVK